MATKIDILEKFINNESRTDYRNYDLAGMRALLDLAGGPHLGLKCVHIAGTNGKGSVACMLASIFRHSGLKTGLYVSPHLVEINERISIDGVKISDADLIRYASMIEGVLKGNGLAPTYFDILTAIAFQYYRDSRCDICVIETGLGGRRDSTNLILPLCSVITEISVDHAHILGDTIEKIAAEKAGIIKNGVPAVTACSMESALAVIGKEASMKQAPVFALGRDITIATSARSPGGQRFTVILPDRTVIEDIDLPLQGAHQIRNAAAAAAAASVTGSTFRSITPQTIRAGLSSVSVPGRMEILSRKPLIVFDPAHNPGAMLALVETISEEYPDAEPLFVISLMADKDFDGIIDVFRKRNMRPVYINLDDQRARTIITGEVTSIAVVFDSPAGLCSYIRSRTVSGCPVVFCGSFRLYGTARNCASILSGSDTGQGENTAPRSGRDENS